MIDPKNTVKIPIADYQLMGMLQVPKDPIGVVLFVHGSGSSRFSLRNQYVASNLNEANIATLLFDLLTADEDEVDELTRKYRFNIEMLSTRLIAVTDWITQQPATKGLPIGYFGASTGGGAAIQAAAQQQSVVSAVVSRGGRPDLAGDALGKITIPTLLIVGGNDEIVIDLNQKAMAQMKGIVKLAIVPGATHLFEEEGTLEKVAILAKDWFIKYFNKKNS